MQTAPRLNTRFITVVTSGSTLQMMKGLWYDLVSLEMGMSEFKMLSLLDARGWIISEETTVELEGVTLFRIEMHKTF